jgi:hypothetical protein
MASASSPFPPPLRTPWVPFLHVPLKATEETEWEQPLAHHIATVYADEPSKYSKELAALHKLRQDMRGAATASDLTARDVLLKYYGQLELLELHFPIGLDAEASSSLTSSPNGGPRAASPGESTPVQVLFTWLDAYSGDETTQVSLAFEKACVIFNIAAILARMGAAASDPTASDRPTAEIADDAATKRAYHQFQVAAGIFHFIIEHFLHAPSHDLSRDVVQCLSDLMVAQAQEILLIRTITNKGKLKLIGKLAAGLARQYSAIVSTVEGALATYFDSYKVNQGLISAKAKYYSSLAHYCRALALLEGDMNQYGEVIARLEVSQVEAKEAVKLAEKFQTSANKTSALCVFTSANAGPRMVDIAKSHQAVVNDVTTRCNKDNDVIYHVSTMAKETLPALDHVIVPERLGFGHILPGGVTELQNMVTDLFAALIPMSVHEKASEYSELKSQLIRETQEKIQIADVEMSSLFTSLNLPKALDEIKKLGAGTGHEEQRISKETESRAKLIAQNEDQTFGQLLQQVQQWTENAKQTLSPTLSKITRDETLDQEQRSVVGADHWPMRTTRELPQVRSFFQLQGQVDEWRGRDAELQNEGNHAVAEIKQAYQQVQSSQAPPLLDMDTTYTDAITTVSTLFARIMELKRARNGLLNELRTSVLADDISEVLVLNARQGIDDHIVHAELNKFRQIKESIQNNIQESMQARAELEKQWKQLQSHGGIVMAKTRAQAQNKVCEQLERALAIYDTLCARLHEVMEQRMDFVQRDIASLSRELEEVLEKRAAEAKRHESLVSDMQAKKQQEMMRAQLARMGDATAYTSAPSPYAAAPSGYPSVQHSRPPAHAPYSPAQAAYNPAQAPYPSTQPSYASAQPGYPSAQPTYTSPPPATYNSSPGMPPSSYGTTTQAAPSPIYPSAQSGTYPTYGAMQQTQPMYSSNHNPSANAYPSVHQSHSNTQYAPNLPTQSGYPSTAYAPGQHPPGPGSNYAPYPSNYAPNQGGYSAPPAAYSSPHGTQPAIPGYPPQNGYPAQGAPAGGIPPGPKRPNLLD